MAGRNTKRHLQAVGKKKERLQADKNRGKTIFRQVRSSHKTVHRKRHLQAGGNIENRPQAGDNIERRLQAGLKIDKGIFSQVGIQKMANGIFWAGLNIEDRHLRYR